MKAICSMLAFFAAMTCTPSFARLDAPTLDCTLNGTSAVVSWSTVKDADGYCLFYAPYPAADPVSYADMASQTSFSADLWNGAAFYLAVKAYNKSGVSPYSNIEYFQISESSAQVLDDRLTEILQNNFNSVTVPGATLLVSFSDGSVWKKAVGTASLDTGIPMDVQMRFRIGSVTKTMVATATLILVDQGKLLLEDTVESILPGLISHGRTITVENLLSHTSRLLNYTSNEEFNNISLNDPVYPWTRSKIIEYFDDEPLIDELVGNDCFYSNSNYYLLGMIVEELTGTSLENFLNTMLFKPLGMDDTYLPAGNDISGIHADGYLDKNDDGIFEPDEKRTLQNPLAAWAAGAVVSTVSDLAVWSKEVKTGSLLSPALQSKRMALDWHVQGAPADVKYGLGVMGGKNDQIGHSGTIDGYETIMINYKGNDIIAYTNGLYVDPDAPSVTSMLLNAVIDLIDAN